MKIPTLLVKIRGDKRWGQAGITLVEVMIVSTLMTIIVLATIPFFQSMQQGYTSLEVNTVLSAGAQDALNRIQHRLIEGKRLFGNDSVGTAYLGRVTPNVSPSALSGSKLPVVVSTGSISPNAAGFSAANVGNSLLCTSLDAPTDLSNITTSSGSTTTIRIDRYIFNYYYLAADTSKSIGGNSIRELWEWHSVKYADYLQLTNITDATKRSNTVAALYNSGVLYAWNSSATAVTAAFHNLSAGGTISASTSHNVVKSSSQNMLRLMRGATSGGFRYSISPNTTGGFNPPHSVPKFATASSNFPSGFEIVAVGANTARTIFIRLVLAAQGSFKGYLSHEQVVLVSMRDIW